jgi:hypothetical protein
MVNDMSRIVFVFVFFFAVIIAPLPARACFVAITPTDSQIPVSIKVGDTYFNMPEYFMKRLFLRAPAIRDSLTIDNFHFQSAKTKSVKTLQIKIATKDYPKDDNVVDEFLINQNTVVYLYNRDIDKVEFEKYIKTLSSEDKPVDWDEDVRLSSLFEADRDPCTSVQDRINSSEPENKVYISDRDVLSAIKHKNDALRAKGFTHVTNMTSLSLEVFDRALIAAETDISWPVRSAAIRAIVKWINPKSSLKEFVVERLRAISENDPEDSVKKEAVRGIQNINRN